MRFSVAVAAVLVLASSSASMASEELSHRYQCQGGKRFTMVFNKGGDDSKAELTIDKPRRVVSLVNQNANSGVQYQGGGWFYYEWHREITITDEKNHKEYKCK